MSRKILLVVAKEHRTDLSDDQAIREIRRLKKQLGKRLVILGHHYQRREIVELSDFRGDSLELARIASLQKDAKYIVFCGVRFMAESAAILAQPHQIVIHPDITAGCPMADMASLSEVEEVWRQLHEALDDGMPIPVTYVNSTAKIKAFCGKHNGITCTSSNAKKIISWALERSTRFLFLPDEHLGRNTSRELDIPKERTILWNPALPLGGNTPQQIRKAIAILWKGYCHVHTFFTVEHVKKARKRYKNCSIVVHPECPEPVVLASDANGSTRFIVEYVENAPEGSTIVVGTELNLVSRLAYEHPGKHVYELARSLCPNMYKINLFNLLVSLRNIGKINVVTIAEQTKKHAKLALSRMLEM